MKNKINFSRGYVGLLMLLIGMAIIALIMVRTDLFSGKEDAKNMIEQGTNAIDQAEAVKNLIEQKSQPVPQ